MGKFVLHPTLLSDITFSLVGSSKTSNYIVAPKSINMNEAERIKILYSSGEQGGAVSKSRSGIVPIVFKVIVFGSTQANAMANYETLVRAIMSPMGGTLEYIPNGLSGVMSTYYHYLQSAPPMIRQGGMNASMMEGYGHIDIAANSYGIECVVQLMTEAWATSDPFTLNTIVSQTTLDNNNDASNDNYLTVPNSSIKGDGVLPVIDVEFNLYSTYYITHMLLHKKKELTGTVDDLDWFEAEDMTDPFSEWTTTVDSAASDGNKEISVVNEHANIRFNLSSSIDRTYLGKVVPIICTKHASSGTVTCWIRWYPTTYSSGFRTLVEFDFGVGNSDWRIAVSDQEFDLPPLEIPSHVDESSTPTIGSYLSQIPFDIDFYDGTSLITDLEFDFLWLPTTDDWISLAVNEDTYWLDGSITRFDSRTGNVTIIDSSDRLLHIPKHYGRPISDLIFEKGYDHRLSILGWRAVTASSGGYTKQNTFDVTVKGIYVTIYPFNEA